MPVSAHLVLAVFVFGDEKMNKRSIDQAFAEYKDTFARERLGPYGLQWEGKPWTTRHKPLSDPLINAHLSGKYWVAIRAPWYPRFVH